MHTFFFYKVSADAEQTKNRVYRIQYQEEIDKYRFERRQRTNSKSNSVKFFGVVFDSKLKFDEEVKKILHGMACGTEFFSTPSQSLSEKNKMQ